MPHAPGLFFNLIHNVIMFCLAPQASGLLPVRKHPSSSPSPRPYTAPYYDTAPQKTFILITSSFDIHPMRCKLPRQVYSPVFSPTPRFCLLIDFLSGMIPELCLNSDGFICTFPSELQGGFNAKPQSRKAAETRTNLWKSPNPFMSSELIETKERNPFPISEIWAIRG